jgi:hypothetical protein
MNLKKLTTLNIFYDFFFNLMRAIMQVVGGKRI